MKIEIRCCLIHERPSMLLFKSTNNDCRTTCGWPMLGSPHWCKDALLFIATLQNRSLHVFCVFIFVGHAPCWIEIKNWCPMTSRAYFPRVCFYTKACVFVLPLIYHVLLGSTEKLSWHYPDRVDLSLIIVCLDSLNWRIPNLFFGENYVGYRKTIIEGLLRGAWTKRMVMESNNKG